MFFHESFLFFTAMNLHIVGFWHHTASQSTTWIPFMINQFSILGNIRGQLGTHLYNFILVKYMVVLRVSLI